MKGKRRREDRVGRRGEPGEERREAARQRGKGRDPAPRGPCASWPRRWPPCWPQPQPQVSGTAVEQRPDPGPGSPLWVACGISGSASGWCPPLGAAELSPAAPWHRQRHRGRGRAAAAKCDSYRDSGTGKELLARSASAQGRQAGPCSPAPLQPAGACPADSRPGPSPRFAAARPPSRRQRFCQRPDPLLCSWTRKAFPCRSYGKVSSASLRSQAGQCWAAL